MSLEHDEKKLEEEDVSQKKLSEDDEAILAMCDDSPTETAETSTMNPFTFDKSTININHSQDIHIGPKTVSTSPKICGPGSFLSQNSTSSVLSQNSISSSILSQTRVSPARENSINEMSNLSSIRSQLQNVNLKDSGHVDTSSQSSYDSDGNSSMFVQSALAGPLLNRRVVNAQSIDGESERGFAVQVTTGLHSPSLSYTDSIRQDLQCIPQQNSNNEPVSPTQPPISAAISNSSNVQMGTQIVYNYYISESDQRTQQHHSSESVSIMSSSMGIPQPAKDFLLEFKEKLISLYQKRTRSSPLPWHRGKQVIPIDEYYTEPEIFAIHKCGNRTTETVNIFSIINSDKVTRFLVEGEAGMGKTLLATKLAEEWAKGNYLQQFKILIFVTLCDFKGSLYQYVREELLPSYFKTEKAEKTYRDERKGVVKEDQNIVSSSQTNFYIQYEKPSPQSFEKVWEYCKSHDGEILFVLDGYDELQKLDKGEIHNLLRSKDFPESKVVVTSRPNILQDWEKKIVVSGFGQLQIMEFIGKYFRAFGNEPCGQSLIKIIEKDDKYWKLAKRPLFCVLLCMLYITGEVGESLPERQSDVMLQIILCLIKWNRKNNGNAYIDFDSLPQEYEKPFYNFGKLCLNTLKDEKSRFTDQEVQSVEGFESKLKQLGFLYNDNESYALFEKKFWKPVHQTFLEYLAAFYMAKHIRECKGCKECKNYDAIFQRTTEVLKFCVGILNNKAYKLMDGQRFPILRKLPSTKILYLLKEAEPKPENCNAVAKLLDQNTIEICTSEIEFEGWSYILSQPFRRLNTLKIAWRIKSKSPDQESSFTEASQIQYSNFFEALKSNESIRCIHIRAKQDGEPFTEDKIASFFSHLRIALFKKNLQELHIIEMKMNASGYLRNAFEDAVIQSKKLRTTWDLRVLKLHTFMEDKDLMGICEALQKCAPSLENLHLEGLEHGTLGFRSLVQLLQGNHNIQYLYISMNQSLFVNVFGSGADFSNDYPPNQMRTELQRMNKTAGKKSRHAFSVSSEDFEEGVSLEQETCKKKESQSTSRDVDPKKELSYLFEKLGDSSWIMEARHHWYLRKASSDLRIPLPICLEGEHKSVFHFLFSSLPETHVKSLTLHQAGLYLTTSDLICLGSSVRKSPHLSILNLEGLDKTESYLPLLIGMGKSPALSYVNLSSSKIVLNDVAFEVICSALQSNTALRNLYLGKWQFHLQNSKESLLHISMLFSSWQVALLDLRQCVIQLGSHSTFLSKPDSPAPKSPLTAFFSRPFDSSFQPWRTLKILSLEGLEMKEHSGLVHRGHLLLPGITNFVNLTSLDLSVSQTRPIQIDNVSLRRFFGIIGREIKQLVELKLDNWEFCLNVSKENDFSSPLRSCRRLKKIQLERVNEILDETLTNGSESSSSLVSSWCKLTFLHQLVSYTPNLEELSLCYYRFNNRPIDQEVVSKLGSCFHDHWHHFPFTVKFFNLSPEVDNILYRTLKKPPCRVKRLNGPSLIKSYEVKCILGLMKR